jgi:hypothetical protein
MPASAGLGSMQGRWTPCSSPSQEQVRQQWQHPIAAMVLSADLTLACPSVPLQRADNVCVVLLKTRLKLPIRVPQRNSVVGGPRCQRTHLGLQSCGRYSICVPPLVYLLM